METVSRGLLYWFLGTIVSTFVALLVGAAGTLASGAAIVLAAGVSVVPLLLARRYPKLGGFIACSMLAAAAPAFLLAVQAANVTLVRSDWHCGMGAVSMLLLLPFAQAIVVLPVLALWAGRCRLAAVWRPAALGVTAFVALLILVGIVRSAMVGPAQASVVDELPRVTLPADFTRVEVDGMLVQRECVAGPSDCTLTVSTPGHEMAPAVRSGGPPEGIVTVASIGDVRIVGLGRAEGTPSDRFAYDVVAGRVVDLKASDLSDRFGPARGALVLAMIGLLAVGVSVGVRPTTSLVWRRLGARDPRQDGRCEEVVSLHIAHFAVALIVGIPLVASAHLGLLG